MSLTIPHSFIAIDLETTGLDFKKDEIIEIALVLFENQKPVKTCNYLVKPKQKLRSFIKFLTGISSEELNNAAEFATIAGELRSFIGDYPLVAHNASFDYHFLKGAFSKVGIFFDEHPVFDTLTVSRIAFQEVVNHRLDTLIEYLGIERSEAHRALPDAKACGFLFLKSLEKIQTFSKPELDALSLVSKNLVWNKLFNTDEIGDSIDLNIHLDIQSEQMSLRVPHKTLDRVEDYIKDGGILSQKWADFKPRVNQIDFANVIERNMFKGGISILEAETGSGKTLSYLLSAALKAASGERVVISTATKALQDQLLKQEFPKIAALFDPPLEASLLKGRHKYICYRKFKEHLLHFDLLVAPEEIESFMVLIPWVQRTKTGDISENTGFNYTRNKSLWNKIASDAASCSGEACPFYKTCPAIEAKKRAMKSNLIFINHSLFLSDLSLDFALLPAYEHIIFDEAHRLPALSHRSLGRSVWFFDLRNILKSLQHFKAEDKGLISVLESKLNQEQELHKNLLEKTQSLRDLSVDSERQLHRFLMKIGKKISKLDRKESVFKYKNSLFSELGVDIKPCLDSVKSMNKLIIEIANTIREKEGFLGITKDLDGISSSLETFYYNLDFISNANREDWVFYLEDYFNPHTLIMKAEPLDVGDFWAKHFYTWIKSVTFTSATLSVQSRLNYFANRMGLEKKLPFNKTPFFKIYENDTDFLKNREVCIVDFLPKPNDKKFQNELEKLLLSILPNTNKNTLVLFTSVSSMFGVQKVLAPLFEQKKKLLLCQHIDGNIESLVHLFRKERGACFLGVQSLWEGVDFPGDSLELLVIPKLPFPNPADPLIAGQADLLKEQGENPFRSLYIPETYINLRQGMGRLIRSKTDSGKVLLLDNRLVLESYGKSFLPIWNHTHTLISSIEELEKQM